MQRLLKSTTVNHGRIWQKCCPRCNFHFNVSLIKSSDLYVNNVTKNINDLTIQSQFGLSTISLSYADYISKAIAKPL